MYDLLSLIEKREQFNSIKFDVLIFQEFRENKPYRLEQIELNVSVFHEQKLLTRYIKRVLEIINQLHLEQPKTPLAIETCEYFEIPIVEQPRKIEQLIKGKLKCEED